MTELLLKMTPGTSLVLKSAILSLAFVGLWAAAQRTWRFLFEATRPMRRFAMYFPNLGVRLEMRINRRRWERKHNPTAAIVFDHRLQGGKLQLSLMPLPQQRAAERRPLREIVELLRDERAKTALEAQLKVLLLGGEAEGYFYQSTDRTVKPGEWAFVTEGILWQEDTLVTFTFLSHNSHVIDTLEVLTAIRSVSLTRVGRIAEGLQVAMALKSEAKEGIGK